MAQKQFHRHYATKGPQLFWIIFAYLILGWFFPVLGWAALICMIGPVLTSVWKGRFWCGNVCPRGNMYDRLLSKYSPPSSYS
ncbi:4Fe-4S binding protein [Prevotella sp. tf2-5]|uniref:4Fe-4S binding protein n=1 Tax=Prevotella sp. tf2-5 TaxID=1761889 RepID=UPI0008E35976|nr:4Fe-4S binding domain-containing protein [Prevotella sp. tf2-5]